MCVKLKKILEPTYGVIIYQEQVMQIAQKLSGFSAGEADILQNAIGKKKRAELEKQKERFVNGAVKNNINKDMANFIFKKAAFIIMKMLYIIFVLGMFFPFIINNFIIILKFNSEGCFNEKYISEIRI